MKLFCGTGLLPVGAEAQAVQDPRTRRTDSLNTSVLGDIKHLPLQTQGPEFKSLEPMYGWTAVHVCNLGAPVVRGETDGNFQELAG